jgi:hypothetical protein
MSTTISTIVANICFMANVGNVFILADKSLKVDTIRSVSSIGSSVRACAADSLATRKWTPSPGRQLRSIAQGPVARELLRISRLGAWLARLMHGPMSLPGEEDHDPIRAAVGRPQAGGGTEQLHDGRSVRESGQRFTA